jgi:hypothetical protein
MNTILIEPDDHVVGIAGTVAELEYALVENQRHAVFMIIVSYDAEPTGGKLVVSRTLVEGDETTETEILSVDVGKTQTFQFFPALRSEAGEGLLITLSSGGEGIIGTINVLHRNIQ